MVDWAQVPDYMHVSCDSFTVANVESGVGGTSASVKINTGSVHLDVTNAGYPIGDLDDSIEEIAGLPGFRIRIGDIFQVSSEGNSSIPACSNFPAALNDYFGNTYYANSGFVGYVSNIGLAADENGLVSEITLVLEDESWKWSQYRMYPIVFNRNDATKPSAYVDTNRGYTTKDIIQFMQRLVVEYGHSAFGISYSIPDRPASPEASSFSTSSIWDALTSLIAEAYGPAYKLYSGGAGHIEIRRQTTSQTTIRNMAISTDKLISQRVEISAEQDDNNKEVEAVVTFGDTVKYFVGDGEIDNELVPAWDWWMDGYFIVTDTGTGQPAMYHDANGNPQLVNPFNIALFEQNGKVIYVPPGDPRATVTFVYGDGYANDNQYPYITDYWALFDNHDSIKNYCHVTTYAMDSVLPEGQSRVIHEGRFKKWRLKDGNPHIGYENVHGTKTAFVYYDEQYFPRRIGKRYPGDPYGLNATGAQEYIVEIGGIKTNQTYNTVISKNFINSATHEIRKQRLKPGAVVHAESSAADDYYEDIPDPTRPGKPMEDSASATSPIFVKYGLINNIMPEYYAGPLNTTYTAERIEVSANIDGIGNGIATNGPIHIDTNILDNSTLKKSNPDTGYQRKPLWKKTLEKYDSGGSSDNNELIEKFFDPFLRNESGIIYGSTGAALRWYYPLRHGRVSVEKFLPHQIAQPIPNKKDGAEPIDYNKVPVPIGIPRIEMFGFVHYEDKPEVEPSSVLVDLNSYYWQHVRTHLRYPRGASLANKNIEIIDKVENQTVERQLGGTYNYDYITTSTLASENNNYFERIVFYKEKDLGMASEYDIQNGNLNILGHHVTVIKFPLMNAQSRFEEFAVDRIRAKVPSGEATYYERTDISPESDGNNIGVTKVVHNLSDGWTLNVTYGGGIPRLRDIYETQERLGGDVRNVLAQRSKNKRANLIGVEAYRRYNQ